MIHIALTFAFPLVFAFDCIGNDKICKRCSFECDMAKYSTRPMNKV